MEKSAKVYPIGIVNQLTGLSQRQIRYYESVGLISPSRTRGRQRLYSPDEIEILLAVKALLSQGLTLQGIHNMLQVQSVSEILGKFVKGPPPDYQAIFEGLQVRSGRSDDLLEPLLRDRQHDQPPNPSAGPTGKGVN